MTQIKVSKQFVDDFNVVVANYECSKDEIEWLRSKVREDFKTVGKSVSTIANEVRNGCCE